MYVETVDPTIDIPAPLQPQRLHRIVVASVARQDAPATLTLLSNAGFDQERIEVVVVEEVPRLEDVLSGSGLHRFLVRLQILHGDEFDEMEQARRELMNGRAVIQVIADGAEEHQRAMSILRTTWWTGQTSASTASDI